MTIKSKIYIEENCVILINHKLISNRINQDHGLF